MKQLIFFSSLLLCFLSSGAQTRLASIFSNNMVLQQNDSVTFWGTAMPTSQVSIIASWSPRDTVRTSANENGRWSVKMKTPKADLVAHTVRCNELKLSNVMLGEVWLCSGQSNMQWSVNEAVLNGEKEALSAT
ncbi:MAG: sugar-binding protein, partial [Mucinivorans sp.]